VHKVGFYYKEYKLFHNIEWDYPRVMIRGIAV